MPKTQHTAGKRKTPRVFGITFRLVLILAGAAMVLSYAAMYINPNKFGIPLFFGLYFIPILLINVFFLLMALIRRSKSVWIPVVVLLPSLLFTDLFYKIGSENQADLEGIKLKIESYNVGTFSASKGHEGRKECRAKVMGHIRENNPDIACFQEFYVDTKEQIDTLFPQYPHKYHHLFRVKNGKYFGNLIVSRYPILSQGKISFPRSTNLAIYADIDHFGRTIRIYNNHLESYNISFTSIVQKFSHAEKVSGDEIRNDLKVVHEKMLGTFIKRSEQVNKILENIAGSSYPAIICGDFNDTPMSYTYHMLAKERKDSFKESGEGFGATFLPIWPLLRIDYILYPKEFESVSHTTHRIKLSDHYPISSEIII